MKKLWRGAHRVGPEIRLAILVAALSAAGALECVSGAWGAGIVLLILAVAAVVAFWFLVVRPARIPRDAILVLRLAGAIHEDTRRSPLEQLMRRGAPSLHNLRDALEHAARDSAVRAVVVEIAGLEAGLGTAHELHRLLRAIHDSGKRVTALLCGDTVSIGEYLVAAGAGEVIANPDTVLTMLGVAAGSPFLKNALARLQVQVQTLQWKEYKGAGEMLSRDSMSPALRESLEAIVADWERLLVETIARVRRLPAERMRELAAGGFLIARAACEAGLIDREGYAEDLRAELDPEGKRRNFIGLGRYLRHLGYTRARGRRARIALIHGVGPVIAGAGPAGGEFISGETTAKQIDRAARDEEVRAIVFRVNSPGGSAVGSDLVWRAVREAQGRGKPVIVSMGDVAGSGGYYVAVGADAIVAEPACITGSIGVVYAKFNLGAMLANLGVNFEFAKSAEISDAMSLTRALSESELAQLNGAMGDIYGTFTARVAEGRRLGAEQAESLARGRVWSGMAACERGLVDELGGLARAVELARERAKIAADEPHEIVIYAPRERWFGLASILSPAAVPLSGGAEFAARVLGVPARWAPAMIQMMVRGGVLLLSPLLWP
jgi:protease IV